MLQTQHHHSKFTQIIQQHTCSTSSKYCLTVVLIPLHCLLDDGSCFLKRDLTHFRQMLLFTSMLSGIQKGLELTRNIGHLAWSTIIWPCSNLAYPLRESVHFSLYNHGHNILRLFETLPNFLFTTSETKRDY